MSKSSEEQIAAITDFCRQLHDYSFVSRYLYNRKEKTVHMTLQPAPAMLRKKLNLDRTQFLVCAMGLNETQIQGFNSMYDVTFANESNFLQYVQRLVP